MDGRRLAIGKDLEILKFSIYIRISNSNNMIKVSELKPGNIIKVDDEGQVREGTVIDITRDEHRALEKKAYKSSGIPRRKCIPFCLMKISCRNLGLKKRRMMTVPLNI